MFNEFLDVIKLSLENLSWVSFRLMVGVFIYCLFLLLSSLALLILKTSFDEQLESQHPQYL
jgi:hypothetical protein